MMDVLKGARVLLVDPDRLSTRLMHAVLVDSGCELEVAATALEALKKVRARLPDLVLIELMLPDMPGQDLARILKGDPTTSSLLAIAVTAKNGTQTEEIALAAGCSAYVRKPIDALGLPAYLAQQLAQHRSQT